MNILLSIGALLAASALLAVLIAIGGLLQRGVVGCKNPPSAGYPRLNSHSFWTISGWFSIWRVALCKLQVFQEMLGLR